MSLLESYWSNRAVLITGASSGLGAALVKALSPFKVHFGLLSRRTEPMKQLEDVLRNSGSRFWIQSCDVRVRREVEEGVNGFVQDAGRLDVAWVNSGISGETSFQNWSWEHVEDTLSTNLNGAIYTTLACLQHMTKQKSGAIVALSSAAAMRGLPGRTIYSTTKIALEAFIESLAAELPEIQFTTIYPGFVDTPINQNNPRRFWLMQPDKAAQLMIRAVAKRKTSYIYPFRMKLLFHLVRSLPDSIYRRMAHKMINVSRGS
ncbi:MAG TPA: SDR family NAD(P)-dependent oxidoreductase [Acidobacteriota bacterium]|nr:SDR family NAD(P)-dependent oxidoreductase [Acidobacteriota bacterium]